MWLRSRKLQMPSPQEALPGRAERMAVPAEHVVSGARLEPPFPAGLELAMFGMGCFWGAERKFWETPGVYSTAVGYAGGFTPNPTYEEVCSGRTGHTEVVRVVLDPGKIAYDDLFRIFWENHDPTQGMRQGNDVGTQYRSAVYCYGAAPRRRRFAAGLSANAHRGRLRPRHDGDPRGAGVLLRRGLSPAVPRQEPLGLLWHRRHRGPLPRRFERGRLSADSAPSAPAPELRLAILDGWEPTRSAAVEARGRGRGRCPTLRA